jgi:hypothetical protein
VNIIPYLITYSFYLGILSRADYRWRGVSRIHNTKCREQRDNPSNYAAHNITPFLNHALRTSIKASRLGLQSPNQFHNAFFISSRLRPLVKNFIINDPQNQIPNSFSKGYLIKKSKFRNVS